MSSFEAKEKEAVKTITAIASEVDELPTINTSLGQKLQTGPSQVNDLELDSGSCVNSISKDDAFIAAKSICPTISSPTSSIRSRSWKPTILRLGPLAGLTAMLASIASILCSLAVLVASDGAAVESWPAIHPSIVLAIFTAFANLAIRFACIQGIVIAWWVRALRGSTLRKLHNDWRASTITGALAAGRKIGLLGLATLFSTVVVMDGPLLQQSTSIRPAPILNTVVPLNVSMAREVPKGYTGTWSPEDIDIRKGWSESFNDTQPGAEGPVSNRIWSGTGYWVKSPLSSLYFTDAPLEGVVHGCHGTCKARVRAPALAVTACESMNIPVDYLKRFGNGSYLYTAMPLTQLLFLVSSTLVVDGDKEKINLVTGHNTVDKRCVGTLNLTTCTLESAIAEYDVTVVNHTATCTCTSNFPRLLA
jgi:FtsZ-binding cell division protein ZapB